MTNPAVASQKFAQFASQMKRNPHTLAHLRELVEDEERRQEVSDRIKQLRKRRGLTQPAVATQMGAQLRTYQNWEAGGGTSYDNYELLAKILGVSTDFLLTGGDVAPPREDILTRLDRLEAAVDDLRGVLLATRTEVLAAIATERAKQEAQRPPQSRSARGSAKKRK